MSPCLLIFFPSQLHCLGTIAKCTSQNPTYAVLYMPHKKVSQRRQGQRMIADMKLPPLTAIIKIPAQNSSIQRIHDNVLVLPKRIDSGGMGEQKEASG